MPSFSDFWNRWKDAGDPTPYVLLDCAGFEGGAAALPRNVCSELECLFTGDLAVELADVGPYLGRLDSFDDSVRAIVEDLLRAHLAIVVVVDKQGEEDMTFPMVHRHFRKHNVVYGPSGEPLFFRYYDPRALMEVLPVLEQAQLEAFFGPAQLMVMFAVDGRTAVGFTHVAGALVEQ